MQKTIKDFTANVEVEKCAELYNLTFLFTSHNFETKFLFENVKKTSLKEFQDIENGKKRNIAFRNKNDESLFIDTFPGIEAEFTFFPYHTYHESTVKIHFSIDQALPMVKKIARAMWGDSFVG